MDMQNENVGKMQYKQVSAREKFVLESVRLEKTPSAIWWDHS